MIVETISPHPMNPELDFKGFRGLVVCQRSNSSNAAYTVKIDSVEFREKETTDYSQIYQVFGELVNDYLKQNPEATPPPHKEVA